ncbi:MAG: hypothetical protein IJG18_08065 [Kiritimatiellae bacterium]|nr:hypothetical protein [Kiritimatiellia bacterium]
MRNLFNWAATRIVAAFALILPIAAIAEVQMTNPVTGEAETYENIYVGDDSGEWDPVGNWTLKETDKVPFVSGGNYDPALVTGVVSVATSTAIDGWRLRVGAYNGARVFWSGGIAKIQSSSTGCWLTADETSVIMITAFAGNQLEGNDSTPFKLSSAKEGGITWEAGLTSARNTTLPFWYYLKGSGTVAYGGDITVANAQVIKQADITLSGTSRVASKTLVTFGSGTTKTFTADAAIKVYGIDGETEVETVYLATVNTTGETTLTTSDPVGTVELVQTSTGIVLYYVDGDPDDIVAKTYKPSISVNFTSGTALSTLADVGVGDYAVPGTSWNNLIGNNGTLSTVTQVDSTGAASTVAGVGVTISGTRGYWTCSSVSAATDLRQGYIDDADGANASPQVVVSGIPYYSYYAVVYFSNNDDNVKFGYVTINGTNYKWDDTTSALVECEGADTDSWGASSPTAWTEGGNYIATPTFVNADGTFTVVGHRLTSARAGIAAIQIVEVPKQAADGELVINVSGDTPYTVSEDATYTTVYVTGAGTLAFDGEGAITTTTLNVGVGATVPMGSSITPTTVTGAGTVVYDGSKPTTGLGWTDSANWTGTVWVKNITASSDERKDWNPALYGNEESTLRFTDVNLYFPSTTTEFPGTVELDAGGLNICDGYGGTKATFAKLTGSGTLSTGGGSSNGNGLTIRDASEFTGTITLTKYKVIIGSSDGTSASGVLQIDSGAVATVASGKTWTAPGGFVVNGTLNADGTLASSHASQAVSGSGTVVFSGRAPTPTGNTWWKNSNWTGTVQMKDVTNLVGGTNWTGTNFLPNDYGNTGSVLELYNCSGWLPNNGNYQCSVPLKVTGTLTINNGISGNKFVISHLSGSGAIYTTSNSATTTLQILEADEFTGYVQLNSKRVVFGNTLPSEYTVGNIYVGEGFSFTVPNSNVAWYGTGGITLAGELKAAALSNFGGGTTITTTDTGVFTLTSTGNGSEGETDTDYARIQGTGSLKYEGTGWRALTTNNLSTAVTLVNEQSGDILLSRALTYTVGSLSGSKNFQGNYGSGSRYLNVIQSKDTEWSGKVVDDGYSRFAGLKLDASSTGTLTLSGTASQNVALEVNGGAVNLTGTWKGATTVAGTFGGTGTLTGNLTFAEGSTFKAFAADDADGLVVSGTVGYPAEGTVTVDVSAIEPETDVALLKAADLDASKFVLADGTTEGYSLDVVDGVLTLTVPHVTITVPSIANTTVTVKIGDNTIGTSSGDYNVAPDSVVTVTYAAVDGYEISGTTEYTIDTSNGETTFDPAGTTEVKRYVASITVGETTTKYSSLQAAVDAVAQNKDIVLLDNVVDGATVAREVTFNVVPGEYTYGDIVADGDYILTTTALEGKTRYTFAQAVIAVTINEVRTLYTMMTANTGIEAANAGPNGTTIEILSGDPAAYVKYLPMFDLNTDTGVFTKVADPVAAVYDGVLQVQVYRTLAEAVAAAENGLTVKLLAGIELESAAEIASGKSITIDLNGKTVAGPAGGYAFSNAGGVTIVGNGTVTGAGGIVTNTASGATVAISNGTYTVTGDLFGNVEGGTIAVSGGTFNKFVADEYVAEGYEVTDNGDGTYGIRDYLGWIYEAYDAPNYTGSWSNEVGYAEGKIKIEDGNTYMANRPSDGQFVTVAMKFSFDDANDEDEDVGDAKAAVRLASGETSGTYQFQLYTSDGVNKVWTNATVDVTATKEQDYTFVFVLDLTNKTYRASIVDGAVTNAMTVGGATDILFAYQGDVSPVQKIEFIGAGSVTSIEGSYEDAEEPAVFVEDESITFTDRNVQLSADQAAWLNKLGAKSAVAEALATLSSDQFSSAYLLNLDLTDTFTYEFTVSDITVGDSTVEVEVTLTRTGTLVDGKSSINGTLKLMGGATLPASGFVDLHVAPVGDYDFSDGDTATWSFGKGSEKFFQPVIE